MEISGDMVMNTLIDIKNDTSVIRGKIENHEKRICALENWKEIESRLDTKIKNHVALREAKQDDEIDRIDHTSNLVKKVVGAVAAISITIIGAVVAIIVAIKGGF